MKNFIIYDKNSESIAAKIQAESAEKISNPYSSIQYERIEIPQEMDADAATLDENLAVVEDQNVLDAKVDAAREAKLEQIRSIRAPKLSQVDQLVNRAFLEEWPAPNKTELKDYRLALLDITEPYKADMSSLDALDIEAIVWPSEPSEPA